MKVLKIFSRINSTLIFFCLFLPFVPPMCSSEKEKSNSEADADSTIVDTVSYENTPYQNYDTLSNVPSSIEEDTTDESTKESNLWEKILQPDGKNFSIIGFIYSYSTIGFIIISVPASIILFILSLFFRKRKTSSILLTAGLLCLILFGYLNEEEVVYGYWITLALYFIATALSWIIFKKEKTTS